MLFETDSQFEILNPHKELSVVFAISPETH